MGKVMYVRLRPYDPKTGHLVRDYTHRFGGQFLRFRQPGVWFEVPGELAEQLRDVRQRPGRPKSPPVFDVCTEDEARDFDRKAAEAKAARKRVEEPSVDTAEKLDVGRGDLSLEAVSGARRAALEEVKARAESLLGGEPPSDEKPVPTPGKHTSPRKGRKHRK